MMVRSQTMVNVYRTITTLMISLISVFYFGLAVIACTPAINNATAPNLSKQFRIPVFTNTDNAYFRFLASQLARADEQIDEATAEMQRAVDLDPTSKYLKKELAALWAQQKQYDKALDLLGEVIRRDAMDIEAVVMTGKIQLAKNNNDAAIEQFEKAIMIEPLREDIYHTLGNIYIEKKEFKNAQRIYQALVGQLPSSYVGYFFLGRVLTELGMETKAEDSFKKTLQLAPELDEPRFRLIDLYQSQGKMENAKSLYLKILSGNSKNVRAIMGMALLDYKSGKTESARQSLEKLGQLSLIDKNIIPFLIRQYIDNKQFDDALILTDGMLKGAPSSSELNYLAAMAYDEKELEEKALTHFRKVGPESDFYKNAALQVGFILNNQGHTAEAIAHVKSVIERIPDTSEPYLYLGIFQEDLEEYEAALASIQKGLAIEPDNISLLFRLGVISDKAGRKDQCIAAMKKVLSLDPKHANALNYLGYTYADLGQNLKEAEDLIQKALQIKPEDGYITDSLGWVYYKGQKYAKALEVLLRAVSLVPDDPIILEHTGDAYLKTNNRPKAIEFYRRSLKLQKGDTAGIEKKIRELSAE